MGRVQRTNTTMGTITTFSRTLIVREKLHVIEQRINQATRFDCTENDLWNGVLKEAFRGVKLRDAVYELSLVETYQTFNKFYPVCKVSLERCSTGTIVKFGMRMRRVHDVFLRLCLGISLVLVLLSLGFGGVWLEVSSLVIGLVLFTCVTGLFHALGIRSFCSCFHQVIFRHSEYVRPMESK